MFSLRATGQTILAVGLLLCGAAAFAGGRQPVVRHLLLFPYPRPSVPGKDIKLHRIRARNASGAVIDVPATAVDIMELYGDTQAWNSVDPAKVPAFKATIPEPIRSRIELFYGSSFGWMAVPRGWLLINAGVGQDGSGGAVFRAPGGWNKGWEDVGTIPACISCMWGETNGLVPAAYKAIGVDFKDMPDDLPATGIEPRPLALKHPDPCTAILRYRPPRAVLPIRAIVLFNNKGTLWERDIYLALPKGEKALGDYILASYKATHRNGCSPG